MELESEKCCWFALRDLSRRNSHTPGYMLLEDFGFDVFTPMTRHVAVVRGRRITREVPFVQDLLFVRSSRQELNPIIERTPTLQYRYMRGGYREPMVVPDAQMERFIHAVRNTSTPRYYRPDEVTEAMCGSRVRIVGGPLDGYEGGLLSVRGSKYRRLLIELPGFLTLGVEVSPDLVEVIDRPEAKAEAVNG